jgi:hypothetical protein
MRGITYYSKGAHKTCMVGTLSVGSHNAGGLGLIQLEHYCGDPDRVYNGSPCACKEVGHCIGSHSRQLARQGDREERLVKTPLWQAPSSLAQGKSPHPQNIGYYTIAQFKPTYTTRSFHPVHVAISGNRFSDRTQGGGCSAVSPATGERSQTGMIPLI